jgi:membrane protein implicated in regulation of membrane protease activity
MKDTKIKILKKLIHSIMRENRFKIKLGLFVLLFILMLTLLSGYATAKTVVSAGEDETVLVNEEVEFQGVGVGEYSWDFDESKDLNGDNDYTNDAQELGKTVTHKFKDTGTYIVTLTVTFDGNVTKYESEITVEEDSTFDPWILGMIMIIIGIILFLIEASSPGFFIGIFASILVVLGIVGIAFPDLFFSFWSPIIAIAVGAVTTILVILFYKNLAPPEAPTTTVAGSLIGKQGIVIRATDPNSLTKGKVKVGSEVWSATSEVPLKPNVQVKVIDAEGVHITVEKI